MSKIKLTDRDVEDLLYVLKRYKQAYVLSAFSEERTTRLINKLVDISYKRNLPWWNPKRRF